MTKVFSFFSEKPAVMSAEESSRQWRRVKKFERIALVVVLAALIALCIMNSGKLPDYQTGG